ncbi:hypothetical protein HMN09_00913400 [Mycena chlorophos]|uniref:Uncharacterized protein n=1 Tax=Mycena chlorophos TaxID=658473 RepID=A0A8H6W0B5_MYCCL|nr:hypothetical protein HMN09_00913400 [Mycena chlorophos]
MSTMMVALGMSHSAYPDRGLQFLSAFIQFSAVTIVAVLLALRLNGTGNPLTRQWWARTSWARLCIFFILADSYLFVFSASLLLFGIGMQFNHIACAAGIYLCVTFYTSSKVLTYLFLSEKVYIVWASPGTRRSRCPVYLLCIGTIFLYLGIILAMYFGRIAEFRGGDGHCEIGLKPTASLPLLSYDLYINVLLTSLFLYPIARPGRLKLANSNLRRVATRTLIAALASLTTSTINIGVLTALHGRELGWLCLGSCGSDVVFNAVALFWVTSRGSVSGTGMTVNAAATTMNDRTQGGGGKLEISCQCASTPPGLPVSPAGLAVPSPNPNACKHASTMPVGNAYLSGYPGSRPSSSGTGASTPTTPMPSKPKLGLRPFHLLRGFSVGSGSGGGGLPRSLSRSRSGSTAKHMQRRSGGGGGGDMQIRVTTTSMSETSPSFVGRASASVARESVGAGAGARMASAVGVPVSGVDEVIREGTGRGRGVRDSEASGMTGISGGTKVGEEEDGEDGEKVKGDEMV